MDNQAREQVGMGGSKKEWLIRFPDINHLSFTEI